MRLGENDPCIIMGGEFAGKHGIVLEGRHTYHLSQVKIDDEVYEIDQKYIEPEKTSQ